MCDYTELEFKCKHLRYIVAAWCIKYRKTDQRCPPNIIETYVILKNLICHYY